MRVADSFRSDDNHGSCITHRLLVADAWGGVDTTGAAAYKDNALNSPVLHIIQ